MLSFLGALVICAFGLSAPLPRQDEEDAGDVAQNLLHRVVPARACPAPGRWARHNTLTKYLHHLLQPGQGWILEFAGAGAPPLLRWRHPSAAVKGALKYLSGTTENSWSQTHFCVEDNYTITDRLKRH